MSSRAFAKMTNAPYTRMKPNLCPYCVHCYHTSGLARLRGLEYGCAAKRTLISCAQTEKGRCADFKPSDEPVLSQADIDGEIQCAREYQARRKARNQETE